MKDTTYLYGKNPLKEAVLASKRQNVSLLSKIYLTKQAEEDGKIMSLIQSNKLTYDIVTYQEIESMVGRDVIHQGVCALLDERALYTSLEEVLAKMKEKKYQCSFCSS
jgi:tRNA G18 (ribose-2'-O)-methylase SpoU